MAGGGDAWRPAEHAKARAARRAAVVLAVAAATAVAWGTSRGGDRLLAAAAAVAAATAATAAALHRAISAATREPARSPANVLQAAKAAKMKKEEAGDPSVTLACVGDSLTHGRASGDWVAALERGLGDGAVVVNAGINGQCVENMRRRLDDVLACRPKAVVVLAGTNDVKGIYRPETWGESSRVEHGLDARPSWEAFERHYEALVRTLCSSSTSSSSSSAASAVAAHSVEHVACCTLPPLGEDPNVKANTEFVARANGIIKRIALQHGAHLIDLNAKVTAFIRTERARLPGGPGGAPPVELFDRVMLPVVLRKHLLGHSYDSIGRDYGMVAMSDALHLNDTGAQMLADLVQAWLTEHTTTPTTGGGKKTE